MRWGNNLGKRIGKTYITSYISRKGWSQPIKLVRGFRINLHYLTPVLFLGKLMCLLASRNTA